MKAHFQEGKIVLLGKNQNSLLPPVGCLVVSDRLHSSPINFKCTYLQYEIAAAMNKQKSKPLGWL